MTSSVSLPHLNRLQAGDRGRVHFDLWTENPAGQRCGTGTAWISLSEERPAVMSPDFVDLDPGPAPNPRPELLLETAPVGRLLARLVETTSFESAAAYAA